MANKKTRILLRSDIRANWQLSNPVLLKGEVGIEYNPAVEGDHVVKFKVGDGVTAWNLLAYVADYDAVVEAIKGDVDALEASVATLQSSKQDVLPEGENNLYLHKNAIDGHLEWSEVAQGSSSFHDLSGDPRDNANLKAEFESLEAVDVGFDSRLDAIEAKEDSWDAKADKDYVDEELTKKANAEDVYTKDEVYTKTETDAKIAEEIGKIKHWTYKVVDVLPTPSADCEHIIYLVPKASGTGYKEYVCINEGTESAPVWKFEEIGDTDIDLSEYRKSADQDEIDNEIKARIEVFEADGEHDVAALETRVGSAETAIETLEEDAHTHTNKDELDLIADGDVAKWNAKQDAITVGDNLTFTNNKIELNFDVLDGGSASDWSEE